MRIGYSFCVLRYVHDPTTQEFVNIGVAVFSAEARFLRAVCTTKYGRISDTFEKIDGQRFRQISQHIQEQINAAGRLRESSLPFELNENIEQILATILPQDDSAIQFSRAGVGVTGNLEHTLQELYRRHVERYTSHSEVARRTDEEVWRKFRAPLDRVQVTPWLNPKKIVTSDYDYEFERSWQNEIWHLVEPVSFDMVDGGSMLEKANRWVGRATNLRDSPDPFKIHMLLGEPTDNRLSEMFIKAQNMLNKMPVKKEFVRESEADAFAEELAREVAKHRP